MTERGELSVAYLVNLYPAPSHTFVRREIAALEELGATVVRFGIRRGTDSLVEASDRAERERTQSVLPLGIPGILRALLRTARSRPAQLAGAFALAYEAGVGSRRGLVRHLASLAEACVIREWLEATPCTHVHAHFESSTSVAMLVEALGGPGFSFTVHGPEELEERGTRGFALRLQRARFVVAISNHTERALLTDPLVRQASKTHVLRCGVDANFLRIETTPVPDVPRFVCVGRLVPRKGHALLVQAVSVLAARGYPVELRILGAGELHGELMRKVAQLGLRDQVLLGGWATEEVIRHELRQARALVSPSLAEGLPVTILEAFSAGRPVLSTQVAGIPELVDASCGWLVPPGSVDALAQGMLRVLQTPVEVLTAMGVSGRSRVAELHDVRSTARALYQLFCSAGM